MPSCFKAMGGQGGLVAEDISLPHFYPPSTQISVPFADLYNASDIYTIIYYHNGQNELIISQNLSMDYCRSR